MFLHCSWDMWLNGFLLFLFSVVPCPCESCDCSWSCEIVTCIQDVKEMIYNMPSLCSVTCHVRFDCCFWVLGKELTLWFQELLRHSKAVWGDSNSFVATPAHPTRVATHVHSPLYLVVSQCGGVRAHQWGRTYTVDSFQRVAV